MSKKYNKIFWPPLGGPLLRCSSSPRREWASCPRWWRGTFYPDWRKRSHCIVFCLFLIPDIVSPHVICEILPCFLCSLMFNLEILLWKSETILEELKTRLKVQNCSGLFLYFTSIDLILGFSMFASFWTGRRPSWRLPARLPLLGPNKVQRKN